MSTNSAIVIIGIIVLVVGGFLFMTLDPAPAPNTPDISTDINGDTTEKNTATPATSETKSTTKTTAPKTTTSGTPTSSGSPTLQKGYATVTYTNTGFKPSTLLITQGTVVQFINQTTGKAMRISADPQEAYNGFSQSSSVGKGGTFSFSFLRDGTWNYTNMNSTTDKGVVIVVAQ